MCVCVCVICIKGTFNPYYVIFHLVRSTFSTTIVSSAKV